MSSKKNIRKVALSTLAASAAVVSVAPVASAAESKFSDVTKASVGDHFDAIVSLTEAGIIAGHGDGTFKPYKQVTRGQVALMLQRALKLQDPTPAELKVTNSKYKDVKGSDQTAKAIAAVSAAGVFEGSKGQFKPWNNISREQMASVLVRAFSLNQLDSGADVKINLAGVTTNHRSNVQTLANLGITKELSDFRATEDISRAGFASFLYRTQEIIKTGGPVLPAVKSINAINANTVEVKFAAPVKDVKSFDFKVAGLTVTNAAIKQTDSNTVVLTTSTQNGGVDYTVTANDQNLGKFKGISAVTPTAIDITTNSIQGVVGKEVTVKAKVTVPTGQSAAGVPVTFNIQPTNLGNTLNQPHVVEVVTDKDGVATYSYTQYTGGTDRVIAYATGKADVRAIDGYVYWGVQQVLSISEVDNKTELANGSKKVYKIKATKVDGTPVAAGTVVNVTFKENVDVAPDKGVKGATITDSTNGVALPFQYTNGNTQQVQIKTDSKGEATFTVTGADATVTPIAYLATSTDGKLKSTDIQTVGTTVQFRNIQNVALDVQSVGTQNAAAVSTAGNGGRDYEVTVRDNSGKIAPAGTTVYVTVPKEDLYTAGGSVSILDKDDNNLGSFTGTNSYALKTDANGVAKFTLIGSTNAYATPTVYLENGEKPGLDKFDAQSKGQIVYFGKEVVENATLKVVDRATKKEVSSVKAGTPVDFEYQLVDQNKKVYKAGSHAATFEVFNDGYNDLTVTTPEGSVTIAAGKTASIKTTATAGKATATVTSNGITSAKVNASSSQFTLANKSASVNFTSGSVLEDGKTYNGTVKSFSTDKREIVLTIAGTDQTVNYTAQQLFSNGTPVSIDVFESKLAVGDAIVFTKGKAGEANTFNNTTGTAQNAINKQIAAAADRSNVTVALPATGDVAIVTDKNLNITLTGTPAGNVTIDAPNADVTNNATIAGLVTIKDVKAGTFTNTASIGNVEITDENGSSFVNNGTVSGTVKVNTIAKVTLGGTIKDVEVTKAAKVTVASGAKITNFVAKAKGVQLTAPAGTVTNTQVDGGTIVNEQGQEVAAEPVGKQAEEDAAKAQAAVKQVADSITDYTVEADVTELKLPVVPDGYTVAVKSSNNTAVISAKGEVTPPEADTNVTVEFEVTKGEYKATKAVNVKVLKAVNTPALKTAAAKVIDGNVTVAANATDDAKLAAVTKYVEDAVNDKLIKVTVAKSEAGKYVVTLEKGNAKVKKDITVTFVTA